MAVGIAVDAEGLATDSTLVAGRVRVVWEDVAASVVLDAAVLGDAVDVAVLVVSKEVDVAALVTLSVEEIVPTVMELLSISNPVTFEDASVITVEI